MEKRRNSERGQALVLVVLCLTVVLGFLGFAVDVGQLFRARQILQTAADAAAIAGAQQVLYSDWNTAAQAAAVQNGITNGVNGATITVNHPPLSGAHTIGRDPSGANNYVEVIVSQPQPSGFYQIVKPGAMTVSARSVASNGPSHNCLYTLGTSGTDINVTGFLASLNMPNCGIVDNSTSSNALSESGAFDSISGGTITVAGQTSGVGFWNSIDCSAPGPCPATRAAPTQDPLAYLSDPAIPGGCHTGTTTITTNKTLSPDCWNGLTLNGGIVNFSPGLYIVNGNLNITGFIQGVTGTGVTFYVTGAINFSGAQYLNLVAPTSGTYNGILFMAPLTNTSAMTFTGLSYSTLSGIFHLPGSAMNFDGGTVTTFNNSIIVKSFSFTGIGQVNDYALVNPATPLTGTRVVE